jgi:hypothetical protein
LALQFSPELEDSPVIYSEIQVLLAQSRMVTDSVEVESTGLINLELNWILTDYFIEKVRAIGGLSAGSVA